MDGKQNRDVFTGASSSCKLPISEAPHITAGLGGTPRRDVDLTCSTCGKEFTTNRALVRHRRTLYGSGAFPCTTCNKIFSRKDNLIRHSKKHCVAANDDAEINTSTPGATAADFTKVKYSSRSDRAFTTEDQLDSHIETRPMSTTSPQVANPPDELSSSLNGSCRIWRSHGAENVDLLSYLHRLNHLKILEDVLNDLKSVKFFVSVKVRLVRHSTYRGDGDTETFPYFTSNAVCLIESSDVDSLLKCTYDEILERMQKYIREGSGWVFAGVELCDLLIVKYRPLL